MKVTFGADPEAKIQFMKFTLKELEAAVTVLKDSSLDTPAKRRAALHQMTGMSIRAAGIALDMAKPGRYTTVVSGFAYPKEKRIDIAIPPKVSASEKKQIPFIVAHEKGHLEILKKFRASHKESREWFIHEVAASYWALNQSRDWASFNSHIRILKARWRLFTDWDEVLLAGAEAARQCLPKDAWI